MSCDVVCTWCVLKAERVAGLVVVDVSPTVSPMIQRTPTYLEAMLRIPLLTDGDMENTPLSTVRNNVYFELAKTIQVQNYDHDLGFFYFQYLQ